jgi:hypothetical protein
MPPSENQQRCVMFVCAERNGKPTPVGTAFLVGIPGGPGGWFKYFVTAGHVVRDRSPRWIRFRRRDGALPVDRLVGGWVLHPAADIAAAPCEFDTTEYIANFQEETFFSDKYPADPTINLGERAYFIGLLSDVNTMAERAIPMVRAAAVGAMNVENVPKRYFMQGVEYYEIEPKAHLIDTYSRSGFSGSPVYVDHPIVNVWPVTAEGGQPGMASEVTSFSALLGVLVAHFGSERDNAGVAIVVPIDVLRDLLDDPDLADSRNG